MGMITGHSVSYRSRVFWTGHRQTDVPASDLRTQGFRYPELTKITAGTMMAYPTSLDSTTKAQNAITNAISLILMRRHTFRMQETEDLYVVGFDPLMCHDEEINLNSQLVRL